MNPTPLQPAKAHLLLSDLVSALNAHDVERALQCFEPDCVGQDASLPRPVQGTAAMRRALTRYVTAFPDLHFTLHETVVENERIAARWSLRGTQRGALMNIPPTGRTVEIRGLSLLELYDGRIRRSETVWDVAGFLRAIALLPDLRA